MQGQQRWAGEWEMAWIAGQELDTPTPASTIPNC